MALTCAIPGKDGIGAISTNVNTYFPPSSSGNLGAGSTTINVGASVGGGTALSTGDLLLIIQMQDSSGTLAGNYEYAQVASVSGGSISLASGLTRSYAQAFTATSLQTYQVIRVPQYSSATISGTITPPIWRVDPATGFGTGGVFAVDVAGTLTMTGTINASGKGFRGAFGLNGTANRAGGAFGDLNYVPTLANINGALKGEGTGGLPNRVFDGTATAVTYTNGLYPLGTAGRAAIGNAGGAANDGQPPAGANQYNSGGGAGSNAGAGGNGGDSWITPRNVAGGLGGAAVANSTTKLFLGGGGGAGSANNAVAASSVTSYPPTAVTNFGTINTFSGATGEVSGSGASGGGIVILRSSTFVNGGGSILANGYDAYSRNPTASTDAAGGAGAGGTVIVQAATSSGGALTISARGGKGGDSNFHSHGPGAGGGGGFVGTLNVTTTNTLTGGAAGVDANNGGDNTPDSYGATAGGNGSANAAFGTPAGTSAPNGCLPNIAVTKSTSTPNISVSGATTATYTITATNSSAGFATGADLVDNTLPPGWTFAASNSITFNPALSTSVLGGFVEGATPGAPAVANSPGAVANLTTNGAPAAAPLWGNMTIPGNGTATLVYTVNIPATEPVGVYHNPAGVKYVDPTRSTAGREIAAATNNAEIRTGSGVVGGTANTTYQTGSVAGVNVIGSNYNGAQAGPAGENVTLQADLRTVKTNSGAFTPNGTGTGGTYTILVSNIGRAVQTLTFNTDQTTDAANSSALLGAPYTITDTLPTGMTLASTPTVAGTEAANWACVGATGASSFTCTRNVAAGNIAAGNVTVQDLVTITAPVRVALASCPGPQNNTATLSNATVGEGDTANNASISATTISCAASLVIAKTDSKAASASGGTNNYVITVTNNGPSAADGSIITDTAGAGITCPAGNAVVCSGETNGAVCPAGPFTVADITGAGITVATLPTTGSLQFAFTCNVN